MHLHSLSISSSVHCVSDIRRCAIVPLNAHPASLVYVCVYYSADAVSNLVRQASVSCSRVTLDLHNMALVNHIANHDANNPFDLELAGEGWESTWKR
jgi:hypothetical protein